MITRTSKGRPLLSGPSCLSNLQQTYFLRHLYLLLLHLGLGEVPLLVRNHRTVPLDVVYRTLEHFEVPLPRLVLGEFVEEITGIAHVVFVLFFWTITLLILYLKLFSWLISFHFGARLSFLFSQSFLLGCMDA